VTGKSALSITNLSKTFPGQRALSDFKLDVLPGEIHALVGENGSGKSTFIKCLSGYHVPDPGARIFVDGEEVVVPYGPAAARRNGLAFIHQDLGLVRTMSVLDNLALSRGYMTKFGMQIDRKAELRSARTMLAEFGHDDLDPHQLVGQLPLATQTIVAVARALHDGERAHVIVLDEPTASMPHKESQLLFETVRRVADSGVAVIYVSHRLEEIFDLCDRVTALRDGEVVGTYETKDLQYQQLVELIVGKKVAELVAATPTSVREAVALQFDDLSGGIVHNATARIRAGEIVGVTGLLGSGGSDLGRLLFGALQRTAGTTLVDGNQVDLNNPEKAMQVGISYVPADRAGQGVLPRQSLVDNVMLTDSRRFFKGWRQQRKEYTFVRQLLSKFNVKPLAPEREIYTLSGGNQQKVVLAKWMNAAPHVLILDEPVQGIDIGAKTEVYGIIAEAAESGTGVLIISTEVEDLTRLCHRVLVMRDGLIVADVAGEGLTRENLTALTYGDEGGQR
jgi:ribose transport system ATP-binding protein